MASDMTPEEQQQVNAMRAEYEQTIVNMAHQCADKAAIAETWATRAKAAEARVGVLTDDIEKLKAPKKKKAAA